MSTEERFGIWGGRAPYGWCHIYLPDSPPNFGAYVGTEAQVRKAIGSLTREYPGSHYYLLPFDHTREPAGRNGKPTKAQYEALMATNGLTHRTTNNWLSKFKKSTRNSLFDRGWVMHGFNAEAEEIGLRLTAAGRQAMARYQVA